MTRASGRTAKALGLSVRQLQRIVAGETPVSDTLALLIIAYLRRGLPEPLWNPHLSKTDVMGQALSRFQAPPNHTEAAIAAAQKIRQ